MTRLHPAALCMITVVATVGHAQAARPILAGPNGPAPRIVVNDNRRSAGTLHAGVLTLRLEARLGDWHPDGEAAMGAIVPAFAEAGRPARIPGPLIRVPAGTETAEQPFYAFALQTNGAEPPPDSGLRLGPPIVVTRGEPVRITVVNALDKPTTVHWHGIELESYYDGVAGFSGAAQRLAPVIAPHDSFVARFTPPRAGTFIYHTHVDETVQQLAGLAGPLIVLEPGSALDSATDHTILITTPQSWEDELRSVLVNGRASPAPLTVHAGIAQRLRFINMTTR
ncbi:MAG: multicopper oxidase domain-containing protein, partial [Gemmatimonadota bacterium]|nr:multicopper oxidase domain-containing protein [Gemmatimonadota bacterium]